MELSEEVKEFIMPDDGQTAYSHRTDAESVAEKILQEGFKYVDSFQKTTDEIINDIVYLTYWDSLRKHYGGYIIVIKIDKNHLNEVQNKLDPRHEAQQAISYIHDPTEYYEEGYFILPKEYIKGYIRRKDGVMTPNPNFNPDFINPDLEKNIEELNQGT